MQSIRRARAGYERIDGDDDDVADFDEDAQLQPDVESGALPPARPPPPQAHVLATAPKVTAAVSAASTSSCSWCPCKGGQRRGSSSINMDDGKNGRWCGLQRGTFIGVGALLAVELLIVVWGVYFPEPTFPNWKSYFTIGMVVGALGTMALGTPPDLTMMVVTLALIITGVITQQEAYEGFSDPGPITVAGMFIVAHAMDKVGAVGFFATKVLGPTDNMSIALVWLCAPVALISAFINNTPTVAAMIPVTERWARSIGVSPSKLLMPLSFVSMLGGMCTLLGTSTNLVISSRYAADYPGEALGLFSSTPYGIAALFIGLIYMAVACRFEAMLPSRAPINEVLDKKHRASITNFDRSPSHIKKDARPAEMKSVVLVVFILLSVIVLAATDVVPIDVGVLCASLLLVTTRCVTIADAYASINGRVMLAIIFAFGVSISLDDNHTNVADWVARIIVDTFSPFGPSGVLFGVCLVSSIVGTFISNNAAALLLYPIVVDLSESIDGLERREAVIVLMVASSASFLSPISFQTNLMVMIPGRYEFLDFMRFGFGLQIVTIGAIIGAAALW